MVRATATDARSASAPLTHSIAAALAAAWTHGSFADLADAAVDVVAEHVRTHGIGAMDNRLAGAFADAVAAHAGDDLVVELDAPHDDPRQLTLADAIGGGA